MAQEDIRHQLDRLSRRERGRLIAGLVNRLGHQHLDLAEDVAQEAMLAALSTWQYQGTPNNPAAWLTRVAHNRAIDRLRHEARNRRLDEHIDIEAAPEPEPERIADPELKLIFLCGNAALEGIDQLALTLRVVSGFTAREIAGIFLAPETAIAQRLSRSKRKLQRLPRPQAGPPSVFELEQHLPAVLKVVYLMFSLGYAPRTGEQLVRRDVALEAVRLAREVADTRYTGTAESQALAALLCFQASRLNAREGEDGLPVLLKDQDRNAWDRAAIDAGMEYLHRSRTARSPSRYHLEAGIASLYASAPGWEQIDWGAILSLYEKLDALVQSPVVKINASVARAFAGQAEQALQELDAMDCEPLLTDYTPFHIARAEVLRLLGHEDRARVHYRNAIESGSSTPVVEYLQERASLYL